MGKLQPGIIAAFFDSALDRLRELVTKIATIKNYSETIDSRLSSIENYMDIVTNGHLNLMRQRLGIGATYFMEVSTDDTVGSTWVALDSEGCNKVVLMNNSGVSIDVRMNGNNPFISLATNTGFEIMTTDSSTIEIRRTDLSNSQVTIQWIFTTAYEY